jgi:hypothetical protein
METLDMKDFRMDAKQLDQPITKLTYRQLRELIAEEVRAQISDAVEKELPGYLQETDSAKAVEAMEWLREHRLPSPPGSPSVVEMLREDRDQ